MGDLEETIFQRNVPGKYSKWDGNNARDLRREPDHENVEEEPDGNEEGPVGEEMELLQYAQQLSNADIPESIRQSILAERATKSSTGVKGVLADYRAAQAMAQAESEAVALQRQQVLTRMVEGAKVKSTAEVIQEEEVADRADIDADEWDDDGDDAFMREFRAKRLQEMKNATQTTVAVSEPKKFGFVREIRSEDFISEIEKEDTRVTVVVHLYEPSVQVCIRLNSMLDELAATMPAVKFLRMQGSSNEIVVDKVALPILTLYRGGETIETLAGIAADFGPYFTTQDITWLLETSIPR